jgi:hypothetical protein
LHPRADDGIRTRDPHLGKVMRYQLRYIRAQRARSSPGAKHDDSPPEWARTNFLVPSGPPLSVAQQRVLPTRPRVLTFDVIRLLAPVPWLSGRASASHAEGRWFDPSRDHHGRCAGHRIFRYPTSDPSPTTAAGYPPLIRRHGHPPSPSSASATRSRSES